MTDTVEPITKEERERYPWYDLEGALTDLTQAGADSVCLRTIRRGCANLLAYESALRASEERIKKLEVRINAVFGLLNSAFEEQESLLKNDYLFSAFSHVFPVTTPTEE